MENQHRKLELQAELASMLNHQHVKKAANEGRDPDELARFRSADPIAWAGVGKVDIQTGIMALVRAVVQPEEV